MILEHKDARRGIGEFILHENKAYLAVIVNIVVFNCKISGESEQKYRVK